MPATRRCRHTAHFVVRRATAEDDKSAGSWRLTAGLRARSAENAMSMKQAGKHKGQLMGNKQVIRFGE
jgi:hypothetical protein